MSGVFKDKIVDMKMLREDIFRMTILSEYISSNAMPGQFVHVKCGDDSEMLLRRPISIAFADRERKTFDIIFQVKGKGTGHLAGKKAGDSIDIMGPLGKPFDISESNKNIAVVGGGIGIFPLLFLLNEMSKSQRTVSYLGFRSKDLIVLADDFSRLCSRLEIATEDGSEGYKGFVTSILENHLPSENFDMIYTCGPVPMLKKVSKIAENFGVLCQVSLEQRMGCGIGTCLVCSCKTKVKDKDDWKYSRVCKDGPVFWSSDIIFD
jgi:dihydroorotate dehydrogenase electron transfer subunit